MQPYFVTVVGVQDSLQLCDNYESADCSQGLGQTVCRYFEQQACILQGSEALQDGLTYNIVILYILLLLDYQNHLVNHLDFLGVEHSLCFQKF